MSDLAASVSPSRLYNKLVDMSETVLKSVRQHRPWTVPAELQPTLGALATYLAEGGDMLMALATLEDNPDAFSSVDASSTSIFAIAVGVQLEFTPSQLTELGTAAFFHDIGMCNDDIYERLSQRQPLDKAAMELTRQHPVKGFEFLENHGLPDSVLKTVAQHHERWKGQGYPNKLAGQDILSYASIVGLCDAYEELIHRRPYRMTRMMPAQAMRHLAESGKEAFDAAVLQAFVARFTAYPIGSFVKLSSGEYAKVVKVQSGDPQKPWVEIFATSQGLGVSIPKVVNLKENPSLSIAEAVG